MYVNTNMQKRRCGNIGATAILPRFVPSGGLWVKSFLAVVQVILAVLVMLGILLQTPKASGLGGTIGGGGDVGGGYRRRRGVEKTLLRASIVFISLFVIVSAVNVYEGR
jgi:protein translocase SecG subunit